jgi:predicted nucleic acid-binding Zn ribbon protein
MSNDVQHEECPFCKNEVKAGATVCSACGAYKAEKGLSRSDKQAIFILLWFFAMPVLMLVLSVIEFLGVMRTKEFSSPGYFIFGLVGSLIGFWLLRLMFKGCSEIVWKRKF